MWMLSGLEEIHDQQDYNLVGCLEANVLVIFLDHSLDFRFGLWFCSSICSICCCVWFQGRDPQASQTDLSFPGIDS